MSKDYSKTFFTGSRANRFKADLEAQGITDIEIWVKQDSFNQTTYTVRWNR